MPRYILISLIGSMLCVIPLGCAVPKRPGTVSLKTGSGGERVVHYKNISPNKVKEMLNSGENIVLIDVRTDAEYNSGHIKGAKHLPISKIEDWSKSLDPSKKTIVYCQGGVRSVTGSEALAKKGFSSVYNMLGGIEDWTFETVR